MIIPIVWKSYKIDTPNRGYWDQELLEDIFRGELGYLYRVSFEHYNDFKDLINDHETIEAENRFDITGNYNSGAIVIIPARYHADKIDEINQDIQRLKWCLLILVGDEESVFPTEKIEHKNIMIYQMTPNMKGDHSNVDRFIPNGYSKDTRKWLKRYHDNDLRPLDWFFAGQVTHKRRKECANILRDMPNGKLIETEGFTQGINHQEYFHSMRAAKIAPCPSGPESQDTFRLCEALEAGCLPIVDAFTPKSKEKGYWQFLFGDDMPLPVLEDWNDLPGTVQYHIDTYPMLTNKVFAWWQMYKRNMIYDLIDDIYYLSQRNRTMEEKITVLIPTSPIKDHPSTSIIEETIGSIRERLPNSEIIIMFDGIREEQVDRTRQYYEYVAKLLWKCNHEWKNVTPLLFNEHKHQVAMTREALKIVKTPTVLFVEHDTPLCESIPFEGLADLILLGDANMIRLHHEALILDVHMDLMLDKSPILINNIPIIRTGQWSQRPHLASTEFYTRILNAYFSPDAKCMIEDGIHGHVNEAFRRRGKAGWNQFKVCIYAPPGDMKRSYHTDARKTDPKFDEKFKY